MTLQHVKSICSRALAGLLIAIYLTACTDGNIGKFQNKFAEGNLTEAQKYLAKIKQQYDARPCALMLVKAYIEAGSVDKAINVYENITFWHNKRNELNSTESKYYEAEACKLIRTALIKNSEYKKAWNYYPLRYMDENDSNNAQSHFVYLSDVVEAMCEKGKQEEARKFVDKNMRWFTLCVNNMEDKYDWQQDIKNSYNSSAVSEKLIEQIETSY